LKVTNSQVRNNQIMKKQTGKKGVLLISSSFRPSIGGVQSYLDDLCEYLLSRDIRVFVVTCQPNTSKVRGKFIEKSENFLAIRLPLFGLKLLYFQRLKFLYENLVLFLGSLFVLLIHNRSISAVNGNGYAFYLRALKLFFPSKRFVLSTHNLYHFDKHSKMRNAIVRWVFSKVDRILTVSQQSKAELANIGLDAERITNFHCWVNQNKFRPMDKSRAKQRYEWSDKFIVLYVGRLVPEKGPGLLMQAADRVDKKITFAFIGDGPMAEELKEAALSRENAIFIGKIEYEELPVYLNASDVFVIPSQWDEPYGRVILEALCCGVPVIGTKRGGIPEIINDKVGILVSPPEKDVENISNAIEELYKDRQRLSNLSKNAIKQVNEKYSVKNAELIASSYN